MKVILASSSPYRKKVFSDLGISFKVIPSNLDESKVKKTAKTPSQLVKKLALEKAKKVFEKLKDKGEKDFLVIGADSTAALKEKGKWIFLDKPKNKKQARKMALLLKGKQHWFYTGLAVINSKGKQRTAVSVSIVYFKDFSNETLEKFLDSGIWQGRAGGYDIKENKSDLIERFEGSYTNILGLPLEELVSILKEFGFEIIHPTL